MIKRRTHSRESEMGRNNDGWMIEISYIKHVKDWKTSQLVDTFAVLLFIHIVYDLGYVFVLKKKKAIS